MRFRKIVLQNWKNFTRAEVEIPDRLFLVGPNASGKSNFLDAFRFLRDIAAPGGGFQPAVMQRGGISAIRCLAARRNPDVSVEVELSSNSDHWVYSITFGQDNQRKPLLKRELVIRNSEKLLERPNDEDRSDPARMTQTYLEQVNVNKAFREIATFFESVRYLHLVPQLVREPERSVRRANDPFGGDFLERLATTPEKVRSARLRRLRNALKVAVPQLEEIELVRDARGTPHLRGKYQHWRAQGAWQTEDQFSDGTLRLIGLLWAITEANGPLLLEEPELSLHPEVVRVLPQLFARVVNRQGRVQLFVSTHSDKMFDDEGIGLHEVLLLTPTPEGTQLSLATSREEIKSLVDNGIPLAEIVTAKTRPEHVEQLPVCLDS
ncbi:MAG: AAA family ATPase [Anaerolineae bacterium]|nr:AAA family ATPase [Anaerolineae bacterium]